MILIVLLERLIAYLKNKDLGPYQESIANIQCGLGQLLLELPIKGLLIYPYLWICEEYSIFKFEKTISIYLISFLLTDLLHYWYHRIHHSVPLLWKIHAVHHQPENFNYTVGLRLPWLHKLTVFPFYFTQALIGVPVEVFLVTVSIHAILQLWNHTELVNGKWGIINKIIVTPSQHRVHHGKNDIYIDRNFAAIFSLWDIIFGTYTEETEKVVYGVQDGINPCDVIESNFSIFCNFKSWGQDIMTESKKDIININILVSLTLGVCTLWLGTKINPNELIPLIILSIAFMSRKQLQFKILMVPLFISSLIL